MTNHKLDSQKKKSDIQEENIVLQAASDKLVVTNDGFDWTCFTNYKEASHAILKYLHTQFDLDLWMTTRVKDNDWIVLETSNNDYGVKSGDIYKWQDSFCSRMVKEKGTNVALNVEDVPEYLDAKIGKQFSIGSYIGLPVYTETGELFGTLCAIDPSPQTFNVAKKFPQVQVFARLLGSLLNSELKVAEQEREIVGVLKTAHHDELTGLLNRSGWDTAVKREQTRLETFKNSITVFTFDLDGLKVINDTFGHFKGDELLKETAECLLSCVRESDVVARFGGDEFAILAVECSVSKSDEIFQRLRKAFFDKKISVSIGQAVNRPNETLIETIDRADKDLCLLKKWKHLS